MATGDLQTNPRGRGLGRTAGVAAVIALLVTFGVLGLVLTLLKDAIYIGAGFGLLLVAVVLGLIGWFLAKRR